MDISQERITEIENKILDIIEESLDKGKLTVEEMQLVAGYVVDNIKEIKSESDLHEFQKNLVVKWPVFLTMINPVQDNKVQVTDTQEQEQAKHKALLEQLQHES